MNEEVLLMIPICMHRKMWEKFEKGAGHYLPTNLLMISAVLLSKRKENNLDMFW